MKIYKVKIKHNKWKKEKTTNKLREIRLAWGRQENKFVCDRYKKKNTELAAFKWDQYS